MVLLLETELIETESAPPILHLYIPKASSIEDLELSFATAEDKVVMIHLDKRSDGTAVGHASLRPGYRLVDSTPDNPGARFNRKKSRYTINLVKDSPSRHANDDEVFEDAVDEFQPQSGCISPSEKEQGGREVEEEEDSNDAEEEKKMDPEELKAIRKERKKAKLAAKKALKQSAGQSMQQQDEPTPQEPLLKEEKQAENEALVDDLIPLSASQETSKSKKKKKKKAKNKGPTAEGDSEGEGEGEGIPLPPPVPAQVSTKGRRTPSPENQDNGPTTPAPTTPVKAPSDPAINLLDSPYSKPKAPPPAPPPPGVDMEKDFASEPLATTTLAPLTTSHITYPPLDPLSLSSNATITSQEEGVEESLLTHGLWIKSHVAKQDCKGEDKLFMSVGNQWTPLSSPHQGSSAVFSAFGVFDGHGGKQAANWCSKSLLPTICKHLDKCLGRGEGEGEGEGVEKKDPGRPEVEAVRRRLEATWRVQEALGERLPRAFHAGFVEGNEICIRQVKESGTTATLAVVVGWQLIIASVGDSMAFLDTGSEIVQVSSNHRVEDSPEDCARVLAKGGTIAQSDVDGVVAGPLRVWPGGLMMTRTIGDPSAGDFCPADPEVRQVTLPPGGARLVIASDGLWDACNPKSLIGSLRKLPAGQAANMACHQALKKRGLVDDITIMVVDFCSSPDDKVPRSLSDPHPHPHPHVKGGNIQVLRPLEAHVWPVIRQGVRQRREEVLQLRVRRAEEVERRKAEAEAEALRAAEEAAAAALALALEQAEEEAEAQRQAHAKAQAQAQAQAKAEAEAEEERRLQLEKEKERGKGRTRGGPASQGPRIKGDRETVALGPGPVNNPADPCPPRRERRDRPRPPRVNALGVPHEGQHPDYNQQQQQQGDQVPFRTLLPNNGPPTHMDPLESPHHPLVGHETHGSLNEPGGEGGGGRGRGRGRRGPREGDGGGGRGRGRGRDRPSHPDPSHAKEGHFTPNTDFALPQPSLTAPPHSAHAGSEGLPIEGPAYTPNMSHGRGGGRGKGRGRGRGDDIASHPSEGHPHGHSDPHPPRQAPALHHPHPQQHAQGARVPPYPQGHVNPSPGMGQDQGEGVPVMLNWQQQQQQQGFGAEFGTGFGGGGRGGRGGGRHFNAGGGGRGGGRRSFREDPPLPQTPN